MQHLLAISVGPVQEFIASARRARDLWFGSYLLSEISKAIAKAVSECGGSLIFPAPKSPAELEPDSHLSVANVILAELSNAAPTEVVEKAKESARRCWSDFAAEAYQHARAIIRNDIWQDQVNDVLEFYAAWVVRTNDYRADRARLMRLLAGRKNCRDFIPAKGRAGVPKSSLDGLRESVLKDPGVESWPEKVRAQLRLSGGEQLDVIGVVKRIAGGRRPYPSVSRIAADPWIRGHKHLPVFTQLLEYCKALATRGILASLDDTNYPRYQDFPYEGTALFPSRYREWVEECPELAHDKLLDDLANLFRERKLPEVNPYLAVVVADGDRMGKAISELNSPDENRRFSQQLAAFASKAKEIVRRYCGVLIYAGGDDVLAFLPVDQCLDCARELHDTFAQQMARYATNTLTLSVGIGIGHFLENLEDLLDYGRRAEKDAKTPDRDALAVHLYKRSGAPVRFRAKWDTKPDKQLADYANLILAQAIPTRLPYDLSALVELYRTWPNQSQLQKEAVKRAMQQDILRIMRLKQPKAGRHHLPMLERIARELASVRDLEQFCQALLIAQLIATVKRQAAGAGRVGPGRVSQNRQPEEERV